MNTNFDLKTEIIYYKYNKNTDNFLKFRLSTLFIKYILGLASKRAKYCSIILTITTAAY